MRRSAYIKAIRQAKLLPTDIPELRAYFKDGYNPRAEAIHHIVNKAREDTGALFSCEFIDVYNAAYVSDNAVLPGWRAVPWVDPEARSQSSPNAEALRPGEAGTQKPLDGGGNMA